MKNVPLGYILSPWGRTVDAADDVTTIHMRIMMLDCALGFLGIDIDDRMDTCIYNSHALAIDIDESIPSPPLTRHNARRFPRTHGSRPRPSLSLAPRATLHRCPERQGHRHHEHASAPREPDSNPSAMHGAEFFAGAAIAPEKWLDGYSFCEHAIWVGLIERFCR